MTKQDTDKVYALHTAEGELTMTPFLFHKAVNDILDNLTSEQLLDEPYFGWCDVEGCYNEACSGGFYWQKTGYWRVCYKHSDDARKLKAQPLMKEAAIEREKTRLPDGRLPPS